MRHRGVPSHVRAALDLRPGERVLAAAPDRSERWVVATGRALHLPAADGHRRVPWSGFERAEWDRDAEVLRVVEAAEFGAPFGVVTLALVADGVSGAAGGAARERLLAVIRERITASVVIATHVGLRGELGVRVVARREPGADTELAWSVVFDEGLDPAGPGVLADAGRALDEVRSQVEP